MEGKNGHITPSVLCEMCGKSVPLKPKGRKFCCRECAVVYHSILRNTKRTAHRLAQRGCIRKCKFCGKEFAPKNTHHVYCCKGCHLNDLVRHSIPDTKAKLPNGMSDTVQNRVMYKTTPRPCAFCGTMFTPFSCKGIYCSPQCNLKAFRLKKKNTTSIPEWKQERECEFCGKLFTPVRKGQLFCSYVCRNKASNIRWQKKNQSEETKGGKENKPMLGICPCCGKSFTKGHIFQLYCSLECKVACMSKRIEEADYNLEQKETDKPGGKRVCKWCGEEFYQRRAGHNQEYCSSECRAKAAIDRKERGLYNDSLKAVSEEEMKEQSIKENVVQLVSQVMDSKSEFERISCMSPRERVEAMKEWSKEKHISFYKEMGHIKTKAKYSLADMSQRKQAIDKSTGRKKPKRGKTLQRRWFNG